jgi:hypothetical protein
VQKYPMARQAIKHLVADGRYDYIETRISYFTYSTLMS